MSGDLFWEKDDFASSILGRFGWLEYGERKEKERVVGLILSMRDCE